VVVNEMSQQAKWLSSGFDQVEAPLLVVGIDRCVAYANPAADQLFGTTPGALIGIGIERLVATERRGEVRNIEDVLTGGSPRRVRSVLRRADGSRLDVSMTVEPCLDPYGSIEAATVRYEVITSAGRMSASPTGRISLGPPLRSSSVSPVPTFSSLPQRPPSYPGTPDVHASSSAPLIPPPTSGVNVSRRAESRLQRTPSETELRLHRVEKNLEWLEERLSQPATVAPLDDPRERARALLVVAEARAQIRHALGDLIEPEVQGEPLFPAPPKLPKL
jgi:PAS domain S-box-containing protein